MKRQVILIALFALFGLQNASAKYAIGGSIGASHINSKHSFAFSVYGYYKFDEQILLGITSGQEQSGVPVTANLLMRLPFGRIILPFFTGDMGYYYHSNNAATMLRAGGGLDWKNGERSSILLMGGYQKIGSTEGLYSRIGLLLEF
ncbi:MAG: hypothetical protein HQK83_02550 [Fibrobacteria bacterium]|nr:hypothetical protein [Fibrobacteria bacterium]